MGDVYRAFGLTIDSEYELPGAIRMEQAGEIDAGIVNIAIKKRSIPTSNWRNKRGLFAVLDGSVVVSLPGCANFLCCGHDTIFVDPEVDASANEIGSALCALALPAMLWSRGEILLHASAAVLPNANKAIVIAGHGGSGKSTVLYELLQFGACILADDIVCLSPGLEVTGLPALLQPRNRHASPSGGRESLNVPIDRCAANITIGAIYVLSVPRSTQPAAIATLPIEHRMQSLLSYRYRPRVPRILGLNRVVLPQLGNVARQVPMYAWTRSEGSVAVARGEISALADSHGLL